MSSKGSRSDQASSRRTPPGFYPQLVAKSLQPATLCWFYYVSAAVFSASLTSTAMLTMISSVCGRTQSLSGVRLFRDPLDYSPPGSPVHGLFQARTLEWVAIIPPPPPPGDLPNLRIEPASLESPVLTGGFFTIAPPEKPPVILDNMHFHSNFPPSWWGKCNLFRSTVLETRTQADPDQHCLTRMKEGITSIWSKTIHHMGLFYGLEDVSYHCQPLPSNASNVPLFLWQSKTSYIYVQKPPMGTSFPPAGTTRTVPAHSACSLCLPWFILL